MQKSTIGNLSEYFAVLKNNDLYDTLSRGENAKYEFPLRSGIIRNDLKIYSELLEDYYHRVSTSITEDQKNHFLAFAQHHGIPTNLVDFSLSPLISLFFSVSNCTENGYVYFISRNRTVSINKALRDQPLGWGMLEDFLSYDNELFQAILPQMSQSFIRSRELMINHFESHANELIKLLKYRRSRRIDDSLSSLEGGVDDFEHALEQYKSDKVKWVSSSPNDPLTLQIYRSYNDLFNSMAKIYKGDINYVTVNHFLNNHNSLKNNTVMNNAPEKPSVDLMVFLLLLEKIEIWDKLMMSQSKIDKEVELDFPFYFTYHPPTVDERVKNQHSVFVFQPFDFHSFYLESYRSIYVYYWQKIVPDFIIEINNPEEILRELDSVGINLESIFCDYDNIAKYTFYKYMKSEQ